MSVYNGEKYLSEAIESILNQTFKDFEFLIINDGSTDSSREIILSYDDYRIKLIENDNNIGLTKSLNKGVDIACGKYIARMDADDISMPERLEKQVDFMENHEDIAVCGSCATIINGNDIEYSSFINPETSSEIKVALFFFNPIAHPTAMIRKDVLNAIGNYDPYFEKTQDYNLWYRIYLEDYDFYNFQEKLLIYRNHKTNITNTNLDKQLFYANICLQKLYSHYLGKNVNYEIVSTIRNLFMGRSPKINIIVLLRVMFLLKKLKRKLMSCIPSIKEEYFDKYVNIIIGNMNDQYKIYYNKFFISKTIKFFGF